MLYSVTFDQYRNARIDAVGITAPLNIIAPETNDAVQVAQAAKPHAYQTKATITYWDFLNNRRQVIAFYPNELDDLIKLLNKVRRELRKEPRHNP